MMLEWPSPSGQLHSRLGPSAGHVLASPLASLVKLRRGPPQPGHAPGVGADFGPVCVSGTAQSRPHRIRTLTTAFSSRIASPPLTMNPQPPPQLHPKEM